MWVPFQLATYLHMELLFGDILWCLDLQALSVACSCLNFAPGDVRAILLRRPHYIPKVPFIAGQPVVLQAFFPAPYEMQKQEILHMLYPVHALRIYVHHSGQWRKSSQFLVCFGARNGGNVVTKQQISHWINPSPTSA